MTNQNLLFYYHRQFLLNLLSLPFFNTFLIPAVRTELLYVSLISGQKGKKVLLSVHRFPEICS